MDTSTVEYSLGLVRIVAYGRPHTFGELNRGWKDADSFDEVVPILHYLNLKNMDAPQVHKFNAKVGTYADFPARFSVGGCEVLTGTQLDAVVLQKGQAAGILTRDCPTIVFYNGKTGEVVIAHAGRDSVLDRKGIAADGQTRQYESVVFSVLAFTGWNPKDISILVCIGIGAEHFSHPFDYPLFESLNKKMIGWILQNYGSECVAGEPEEGKIDLFALIKNQCIKAGIPSGHIQHDGVDTYTDPRFWSTRNKTKNNGLNLIVVINK